MKRQRSKSLTRATTNLQQDNATKRFTSKPISPDDGKPISNVDTTSRTLVLEEQRLQRSIAGRAGTTATYTQPMSPILSAAPSILERRKYFEQAAQRQQVSPLTKQDLHPKRPQTIATVLGRCAIDDNYIEKHQPSLNTQVDLDNKTNLSLDDNYIEKHQPSPNTQVDNKTNLSLDDNYIEKHQPSLNTQVDPDNKKNLSLDDNYIEKHQPSPNTQVDLDNKTNLSLDDNSLQKSAKNRSHSKAVEKQKSVKKKSPNGKTAGKHQKTVKKRSSYKNIIDNNNIDSRTPLSNTILINDFKKYNEIANFDFDQQPDESNEVWSKRLKSQSQILANWQKQLHQQQYNSDHKIASKSNISVERLRVFNNLPEDEIAHMQKIVKSYLVRKKFFNTIVAFKLSEGAKKLRFRNNALKEIIDTEKTYCATLESMIKYFATPLSTNGTITAPEYKLLFNTIANIFALSQDFLSKLNERFALWPTQTTFGDLFVSFMCTPDSLFRTHYTNYIDTHQQRLELLTNLVGRPEYVEWEAEVFAKTNLQLGSILITPVQRMPRYQILIDALIKFTSSKHTDYSTLLLALDKIKDLNFYINQHAKKAEELQSEFKQIEKKQESRVHEPKTKKNTTVGKKKVKKGSGLKSQKPATTPALSSPAIYHDVLGKLRVTVIAAKGLSPMDKGARSDPYAVVTLGDQSYKTKMKKKTLKPVWDEEFLLTVTDEPKNRRLVIQVLDWNRVAADKYIGHLSFKVDDFMSKPGTLGVSQPPGTPEWHKLESHTATVGVTDAGKIQLAITFYQEA